MKKLVRGLGKLVYTVRCHLLFICLIAVTLQTICSLSYAQDTSTNSEENFFWVSGGGGPASEGDSASGVSLSYQTGKHLFSVRYVMVEEYCGGVCHKSPKEVWDVGLLYGRIKKASYGFASISGGISEVRGVRRGGLLRYDVWGQGVYEGEAFSTVGVPLEVQLFWTPFSFFGIGIYGFGDMNTEQSFGGALLSISIGKLR